MAELKGRDLDRDPETGQPEDHLGGVAGGAFAGGTAGGVAGAALMGATTGTIAGGPIGMVTGAIAGAVAGSVIGGITGKALAERINPQHEDEHWRNEFPTRSYAAGSAHGWDHYEPAFRLGYERYPEYHGRSFDEVEPEFAHHWTEARGESALEWEDARPATRDAFERLRTELSKGDRG